MSDGAAPIDKMSCLGIWGWSGDFVPPLLHRFMDREEYCSFAWLMLGGFAAHCVLWGRVICDLAICAICYSWARRLCASLGADADSIPYAIVYCQRSLTALYV